MNGNSPSYADFVQPAASEGELSQLARLAEEQARAEATVADLEAQLAKAREIARDYAERQVPELMDSIGISEFKTATGLKIEVAETIRASIPKALAPRAFDWLRRNGSAALIKRTISVGFSKGEDDKADALREELGDRFEFEDNSAVHPSTLSAFVREKLQKGDDLPLDLFGVHRQRVSKIKT